MRYQYKLLQLQSCRTTNINDGITALYADCKETYFLSGSLLDHVYVKHANKDMIHSSVISVYYSDHDAIRITIPMHSSVLA